MNPRTFRETAFSLWEFKFVYTVDQLLEDGCTQEEVLNYFQKSRLDAGFVWRSAYADHLHKAFLPEPNPSKAKSFFFTFQNLFKVLRFMILIKNNSDITISTRTFNVQQFRLERATRPWVLNLKSDLFHPSMLKFLSTEDSQWKKLFKQNLKNSRYSIADHTTEFLLENIDAVFPVVFTLKPRVEIGNYDKCTIINFAGDIFKSRLLFHFFWLFFNGSIQGAQHGGGYNHLESRSFAAEMKVYSAFHLRILKKRDYDRVPIDRVELIGPPGIILVASMPVGKMEAFRQSRWDGVEQRIAKKREVIRKILKSSGKSVYIKEHPKSSRESYCNTDVLRPKHSKAPIWARESDMIVLEAPGTTMELSCIENGLNYICVFDSDDFPLSEAGKSHCDILKKSKKLLNVEQFALFIRDF